MSLKSHGHREERINELKSLLLNSMGLETAIDPMDLVPLVHITEELTGVSLGGKSFRWFTQQYNRTLGGDRHGG